MSVPYRDEGLPVSALQCETGLTADEISKACALLKRSNLVTIQEAAGSGRERILMPTARGTLVLDKILAAAADRLWKGIPPPARGRRVSETTRILRKASNKLLGPIQLSIFDKCASPRTTNKPRKTRQSSKTPETRTESPKVRKSKMNSEPGGPAADQRLKAL